MTKFIRHSESQTLRPTIQYNALQSNVKQKNKNKNVDAVD